MIKQTLKKRASHKNIIDQNNLHTSIQFSLDGFSFCIHQDQEVVCLSSYDFESSCTTPQELLPRIKEIFQTDELLHYPFKTITAIHSNSLNTIVPNAFFKEELLKDYLDFNIKTFASDYFTYDDIQSIKAKNVYIPFVNINNYLIDHFGDFDFYHHQTVLLKKLIEISDTHLQVYAHLNHSLLDIVVTEDQKLLFANTFSIQSSEDFIYYLLFVYEQLQLDTRKNSLVLIGNIDESSEIYKIAFKYIEEVRMINSQNDLILKSVEFNNSEHFLFT